MEYKLCKDNGNMIRCDFDCRKCANLVYEALTDENKNLKKELDKWDKERDGFFNEIKRITEERNKIHDELKELKKENKELIDKCQALEKQLEWANENIESLNNKCFDDGFQIMSKNQTIMELEEEKSKLHEELEKENDYLDCECESLLARFSERIAELEKALIINALMTASR